ncbi:hypothetical protein, partial [Pseudorhodobacter sp.]|uniref:hypothetical protein n=1 Tax=Pseudorhodobacter sp. TaxID=1934400 RepID=UPI0026486AA5
HSPAAGSQRCRGGRRLLGVNQRLLRPILRAGAGLEAVEGVTLLKSATPAHRYCAVLRDAGIF